MLVEVVIIDLSLLELLVETDLAQARKALRACHRQVAYTRRRRLNALRQRERTESNAAYLLADGKLRFADRRHRKAVARLLETRDRRDAAYNALQELAGVRLCHMASVSDVEHDCYD